MSTPCKNCGRNTETIAEPLEWKEYKFCSEPCLTSYLDCWGVNKRSSDYPIKKKKIMDIMGDLPTPLKVVTWLNIVLAVLTLVQSLTDITSVSLSANIENGFNVLLSVLIVIGIIQASRLIRIIVLICSWIIAIMIGLGIPFLVMQAGIPPIFAVILFSVSVITIWGLCTRKSRAYFGY